MLNYYIYGKWLNSNHNDNKNSNHNDNTASNNNNIIFDFDEKLIILRKACNVIEWQQGMY